MFLQCWFEHVWFSYSVCWLIILHDISFEVGLPVNSAEAVHVSSPLPVVEWPTYPTPTPEAARTEWNWMTGHDVEWLAYDLLYFLMTRGWTWSISRKSDGSCHDMVKNSSLDKQFHWQIFRLDQFQKTWTTVGEKHPNFVAECGATSGKGKCRDPRFSCFRVFATKHSMCLWNAFFLRCEL